MIRSEKKLTEIIGRYEHTDQFLLSQAYGDGGACNPFPRLHRAILNQMDNGDATLSRYAIWANTVRDNIVEAINLLETDRDKAIDHLKVAINSFSCFCDIQAHFDPFMHGEASKKPVKMDLP